MSLLVVFQEADKTMIGKSLINCHSVTQTSPVPGNYVNLGSQAGRVRSQADESPFLIRGIRGVILVA